MVSVFNNFVNLIVMDVIKWCYYIVYCVILGFEVVIMYFYLLEIKGRGFEEIVEIFDGFVVVIIVLDMEKIVELWYIRSLSEF